MSEDIVISNVILYGELSDYKTLLTLVSRQSFENVVRDIEKTGKYKKRINFIKKIIL